MVIRYILYMLIKHDIYCTIEDKRSDFSQGQTIDQHFKKKQRYLTQLIQSYRKRKEPLYKFWFTIWPAYDNQYIQYNDEEHKQLFMNLFRDILIHIRSRLFPPLYFINVSSVNLFSMISANVVNLLSLLLHLYEPFHINEESTIILLTIVKKLKNYNCRNVRYALSNDIEKFLMLENEDNRTMEDFYRSTKSGKIESIIIKKKERIFTLPK